MKKDDANSILVREGPEALRKRIDETPADPPVRPNGGEPPPPMSEDDYGFGDPRPIEPLDGGSNGPVPKLEVLDVGDDDKPIPPRQWLLGNAFAADLCPA